MDRYVGKLLSFIIYSVINHKSSSICFDKNGHHQEAYSKTQNTTAGITEQSMFLL
jgi:hypothetical protein